MILKKQLPKRKQKALLRLTLTGNLDPVLKRRLWRVYL